MQNNCPAHALPDPFAEKCPHQMRSIGSGSWPTYWASVLHGIYAMLPEARGNSNTDPGCFEASVPFTALGGGKGPSGAQVVSSHEIKYVSGTNYHLPAAFLVPAPAPLRPPQPWATMVPHHHPTKTSTPQPTHQNHRRHRYCHCHNQNPYQYYHVC